MMKQLGILTLILCVAIAVPTWARAQQQESAPTSQISTKIVRNSTVYMEPMEGFESYLAAAFQKKRVQLVPVADKDKADYIITGTSEDKKAGWAKMVVFGNIHSDAAASISMVDKKSGAIVFAYAVNKKNTLLGQQTTAEACAKHLQERIDGKD